MTEATEANRKIKLSRGGNSVRLIEELSNLEGVIWLLLAEDRLEISYAVEKIQWQKIEQTITNNQFEIYPSLLSKWARRWYQFSDENIRDNFKHKPHCCNKLSR